MKSSFKFLIIIIIFYSQVTFSEESKSPEVNVLTWWGYLVDPWVQKIIYDKCHTKISYDEYYTNDDFMRRFHEYKAFYDILIFPDMDYEALKNEIRNDNSNIFKNADNYETHVKENYKKNHYQHNIAYFMLSFHGFLYNPENINLSENDDIESIFEKSKSKVIVLSDEPIYLHSLLNKNYSPNNLEKDFSRLALLSKNSKIVITNQVSSAYADSNFAFAYTWPGTALYAIEKQYKNYKFMIHPNLSFVYTDSLASLNNKPNTQCVANVMASKEFLSKMQNDALYFSPYGDTDKITNKTLRQTQKQFFINLPKLTWLKPISEKKYNALNRAWSYYFRLNQQLNN